MVANQSRRPKLGLVDSIQARIRASLEADPFQRDPEYILKALPTFEKIFGYFRSEVRGYERIPPPGPFLMVGNHSGGMYTPDAYILLASWLRKMGVERPTYAMAHSLIFASPLGDMFRRLGALPASTQNAERALDHGAPLMIYPGGDYETFRPWHHRNRIDFGGRKGFIRLALRKGVPIVPVVSHGSHDSTIVLARGDRVARLLELDRVRVKIFPWILSVPWGVVPGFVPSLPLPSRIWIEFCEPLAWPHLSPAYADDEDAVEACYQEVTASMQLKLTELVALDPFPLLPFKPQRLRDWQRKHMRLSSDDPSDAQARHALQLEREEGSPTAHSEDAAESDPEELGSAWHRLVLDARSPRVHSDPPELAGADPAVRTPVRQGLESLWQAASAYVKS